jgi:ethanolamine utilization protein EutM
MPEYALGLIETRGLVGSITAADIMLKTARVTLLGIERIKNGMVTVQVAGEVAAVQAAVAAASEIVPQVGTLVSSHVIPRPQDEIEPILQHRGAPRSSPSTSTRPVPALEVAPGADDLDFMTVPQLRKLARGTPGLGIAGRQISKANRQVLIDELRKHRSER